MIDTQFYDFDVFEEDMDEDELDFDDCGMMPDGFCSMAGSEWCDFECPHNCPQPPSTSQEKSNG